MLQSTISRELGSRSAAGRGIRDGSGADSEGCQLKGSPVGGGQIFLSTFGLLDKLLEQAIESEAWTTNLLAAL